MKNTALTLYKLHGSIKSSEEGSSANLKKEDTSTTYQRIGWFFRSQNKNIGLILEQGDG